MKLIPFLTKRREPETVIHEERDIVGARRARNLAIVEGHIRNVARMWASSAEPTDADLQEQLLQSEGLAVHHLRHDDLGIHWLVLIHEGLGLELCFDDVNCELIVTRTLSLS